LIVTIFGGSQPSASDAAYEEAFQLGAALAATGHTVCTGGYVGTMEAASKGAAQAGGHVVGITCREIESWRPIKVNRWVTEEWSYATLSERLTALIKRSDAAIALPGGIGTLAEILMAWNHLAIQAITPRPLILVGEAWKTTLTTFIESQARYIAEHDRAFLHFAKTIKEAVVMIEEFTKNQNKQVTR